MKQIRPVIMKMKKPRGIAAFSISLLIAWFSKSFLTPLIFTGKDFDARSLPIKILLVLTYAIVYSIVFLNVFSRLLDWLVKEFCKNRQYYIVLLVVIFLMSYPLMSSALIWGHDLDYHLLRIQSIKESILAGQLPVRVNPLFLNGYGYGSSLFYTDIFLYIPALFLILGVSIEVSYKLFLVLTFIMCFNSTYYCGKGIAKEKYAAIIIALIFCLSQYYLQNIYTRAALGELQAFVFLPFIIYGLYNLLFEVFDKYWLFIIGFIGLFFSHLITFFIAGLLSIVICLFAFKKIIFDKNRINKLLISSMIVVSCTIGFWLPLLEQILTNSFRFMHSSLTLNDSAVKISTIFANSYVLNKDTVSFGFSTLLLCLMWFFPIMKSITENKRRIINWSLSIGFLLLFVVSDAFPWNHVPQFLNIIQFPWRFYGFASIFFAIAIGIMMDCLFSQDNKNLGLVLIAIFMCSSAIHVIKNSIAGEIDIPHDYYKDVNNTFFIGSGEEWLPTGVDISEISTEPPKVMDDNGNSLMYTKIGQKITVDIDSGCEYIDVPMIYYLGYSAVFIDNQTGKSEKLDLNRSGPNHTIRVECWKKISTGSIIISYTGTVIQRISFFLNLFFILSLLLFSLKNKISLQFSQACHKHTFGRNLFCL